MSPFLTGFRLKYEIICLLGHRSKLSFDTEGVQKYSVLGIGHLVLGKLTMCFRNTMRMRQV